jgi:hypothetical protein
MKTLIFSLLCALPAVSQTVVTFPNANVYQSPYTWRNSGGAEIAPAGSAYNEFYVTGTTTFSINIDTSINSTLSAANSMPEVKYHIDTASQAGTWSVAEFPYGSFGVQNLSLATGLSPTTTYLITMYATGGLGTDGNGWSGTSFQTKINSLQFDSGATLSAITPRPNTCLILGASYEEPYFGGAISGPVVNFVDPTSSWTFMVPFALGCEYGAVGIGTQGWINPGNGGYPAFPSSWNSYDSTHAKTFSSPSYPQYVIVDMNANDNAYTDASVTAAVQAWIPNARAAFGPKAQIFLVIQLDQIKANAIGQAIANAGDQKVHLIQPSNQYVNAQFSSCGSSWLAPDCIHPTAIYQGLYSAFISAGVEFILQQIAPGTYLGGSVTMGGSVAQN